MLGYIYIPNPNLNLNILWSVQRSKLSDLAYITHSYPESYSYPCDSCPSCPVLLGQSVRAVTLIQAFQLISF